MLRAPSQKTWPALPPKAAPGATVSRADAQGQGSGGGDRGGRGMLRRLESGPRLCLMLLCCSLLPAILGAQEMCVGLRKRTIRICPHASEANYRERRFPQTHCLFALAEVTRPRLLRPQRRESNQEGEPLESRWRGSRREEWQRRTASRGAHLRAARAAGPYIPIDKKAGAARAPGGAVEERGGARRAPGPRPRPHWAPPSPGPARAHPGEPRACGGSL